MPKIPAQPNETPRYKSRARHIHETLADYPKEIKSGPPQYMPPAPKPAAAQQQTSGKGRTQQTWAE